MDRFFSKVTKTDCCWNWTASSRGKGYGAFKFEGKTIDAHRMAYELHYGKIPKDLFVCHKCDNPKCVNPEHLFLGTHSDNMRDAYKKGRLQTDNLGKEFEKGHKPINSLLKSREEILHVKKIVVERTVSLKKLSESLNLPHSLLKDISSGRVYENVKLNVDETKSLDKPL